MIEKSLKNATYDVEPVDYEEYKNWYKERLTSAFEKHKKTFTDLWEKENYIANDSRLNRVQKTNATMMHLAESGLNYFSTVTSLTASFSESLMLPYLQTLNIPKGIGCLPVAKQLDPVINLIDIHMVMVPPSPAPVPMPYPFMGFSLRPKDFLALAAMTISVAAIDAFEQTVQQKVDDESLSDVNAEIIMNAGNLVNNVARMFISNLGASVKVGIALPRTVAGTSIRCLEHAPVGGGFHPVADNTITKNTGHSWLGSMFVVADGSPLVGACAHLQNVCSDVGMTSIHDSGPPPDPEKGVKAKLYVPTGMIIPIPLSRFVLTNPIPSAINPLSVPKRLFHGGFNKLKAKRAKQVEKNADNGKPCSSISTVLNKVNKKLFDHEYTRGVYKKVDKTLKTYVGHPVDVVGGDLFTDSTDFTFTGVIPLSFKRIWYSDSAYKGPLGHGWHHSYDMALFVNQVYRRAQVRLGDGRLINFDRIPTQEFPMPRYHRSEKLWLCYHAEGYYYLKDQKEEWYLFDTPSIANKQGAHLLSAISNREGFALRFTYDSNGSLTKILDSVDRVYTIENDQQGRIINVWTAAPEEGMPKVCLATYQYNQVGDLIVHYDEIQQPLQMHYEQHLLVKEIWRNGHHWFFKYDGKHTGAKCIETWGDGGIQHFKLTYYQGETHVMDGEGYRSIYKHRHQLVYETLDAKGALWKKYYNKYGELERSIDPLGNTQTLIRDDFGNIKQVIEPDGQFTQLKYLDVDYPYLPTEVVDSRGGKWSYKYNQAGRIRTVHSPLGAKTEFTYQADGLISEVSNGLGARAQWKYDNQYNIVEICSTTGQRTQYAYDLWNRCIQITNARGAQQNKVLDYLGRALVINDFDGHAIHLKYDALDNVIQYEDQHRSIQFRFKGMHKLISRKEEGKVIRFDYDSNERLRAITNEEGQHYTFVLDAVGDVIAECGFDGVEKKYKRNEAGWITTIQRPNQRWTQYAYDEMGQITQVDYSDETRETYVYTTGLLRQAVNSAGTLDLHYDMEGHLIEECFNGQKVQSTYDAYGRRLGLHSSLGADFEHQFDAWGNVVESQYNDWKVIREYDPFGRECLRMYEGGMQQTWEYDPLGRLVTQGVNKQGPLSRGVPQFYREYSWDVGGVLKQITDQGQKHTRYQRDKRGFLQQIIYQGKEVEERGVDTTGNLYQQLNCKDRIYSKNRLQETKKNKYSYDKEGFLTEKIEKSTGKKWTYQWNGAGMLKQVIRPDGYAVYFQYDALGRRVSKRYKTGTTHYVWQGDVVLHEYKCFDAQETIAEDIITWVFEEGGFVPLAKLKGKQQYSLVADHLGTPIRAYSDTGDKVWERELDSFGNARMTFGDEGFCSYLYQGQTQDKETGLAYNRFRYYDPEVGNYIAQDPIGLAGNNPTLYGYVADPTGWLDVFGLIIIYRALNETQEFSVLDGADIYAKNKNARFSVQKHVDNGRANTQFISATKQLSVAEKYAAPNILEGKLKKSTIIAIDTTKLGDSKLIDISSGFDPTIKKKLNSPGFEYAKKDAEVLITGKIPKNAYTIVECG
ncbi:DUF6531 domain-containing protein [Myroides odoratus]|uniref:DUF6531 domain-containing protein n=1 Tax=Myroides odoratus TaxID=256 RepID=UPI00333F3B2F